MHRFWRVYLVVCLLAGANLATEVVANPARNTAAPVQSANCKGQLAQKIWKHWDEAGLPNAQQHLRTRLIGYGDTYVLYDLQTQLHNLMAMATRCGEVVRLRQMAALAQTAYTQLETEGIASKRRRWVCRGGAVCNPVNRLVNTEVMLNSVQFMAFAAHTANALHAHEQATADDRQFALMTARVATEHLLRWGDARAVQTLQVSQKATLDDVKDGSSRYLLTDKVLWQLTVYAHLAGMLQRDAPMHEALDLSPSEAQQLRSHVTALAGLVQRRTRSTSLSLPSGQLVQVADLDAGFWQHYKDNRYAAYEGEDKPAVCEAGPNGGKRAVVRLAPANVPLREDIGWDLSHARRLVRYFEAMDGNRSAMQTVWHLPAALLPSQAVMRGFAQNLLSQVWNQDVQRPLFTNYFSGANGWYRVAYDNGTGQCREGTPPYGLTHSFPTGGYAIWGRWVPQLSALGWQLLALAESSDPDDKAFMSRHYRSLTEAASVNVLQLQQLMFWPSLIANP